MSDLVEHEDSPVGPAHTKKAGRSGYRNYATVREVRMAETIHKLRREAELLKSLVAITEAQNLELKTELTIVRRKITRQLQRQFANKHKANVL